MSIRDWHPATSIGVELLVGFLVISVELHNIPSRKRAFDSISTSAFNRLGSKLMKSSTGKARIGAFNTEHLKGRERYHVVHQPGPGVHGVIGLYDIVTEATVL